MKIKIKHNKTNKFYKYVLIRFLMIAIILTSIFIFFQVVDKYIQTGELIKSSAESQAKEAARIIDQRLMTAINILNDAILSEELEKFTNQTKINQYDILLAQNRLSKTVNLLDSTELSFAVYNKNIDSVVSNIQSFSLKNFIRFIAEDNYDFFIDYLLENNELPIVYEVSNNENEKLIYIYENPKIKNTILFIIFEKDSLLNHTVVDQSLFDFEIVVSDEKPTHSFVKSKVNKNLYYSVSFLTSVSDIFISQNMLSIIINLLLLIPLCIFLVLLSTNLTYRPIKELVKIADENFKKDESEAKSGNSFDEIEYIKTRINSRNIDLSSKELILKEILYGIYKEGLDEIISKNQINLTNSDVYFIYITIRKGVSHDILNVQYIKFIFGDVVNNINIINISDLGYVILIQDIQRDLMLQKLNALSHTFEDFYIIISKPNDVYNISTSFYYINELIKTHSIGNTENIIKEEDILITLNKELGFTIEDEKLLVYHIGTKNKTEYINVVNKTLNALLEIYDKTKKEDIFVSIFDTLNRLGLKLNIKQEVHNSTLSTKDTHELKSMIISLFLKYYDAINEEDLTNDIKYKFLEFIKDNYDQDISLVDLADKFNLSMNYVGVLFKEKTGENFKSYLNTYRINMAKQIILDNPNIKIKDLSVAVGFANINTFIRVFKEHEGFSPGQYQKLNTQI